ncbi:hypothetical protein H8N00_34445 [Streptomyces sp. AC563]|nr:hypothetical protein [Streptomyces buecherae]
MGERDVVLSVLANVSIGLLTSVLGGCLVWLWERGKHTRTLNRKGAFFGVRPGGTCLIVLGNKHDAPGAAHHRDVRATVELAMLAGELGCTVTVESDDFRGSNGDHTEFCVGGPLGGANARTAGHLSAHLPGVTFHPYGPEGDDSVAIEVAGQRYRFDPGNQSYALVAKFTPQEFRRPIILVCGQSAVANQAAIHFLRREYAQVAARLATVERYCVLIKVSGITTYDYHRAEFVGDVTGAAFGDG